MQESEKDSFDVAWNLCDEFAKDIDFENDRIVCITSGGTSIPFEVNTVRSIENFSSG